jgi:hypothetical protein
MQPSHLKNTMQQITKKGFKKRIWGGGEKKAKNLHSSTIKKKDKKMKVITNIRNIASFGLIKEFVFRNFTGFFFVNNNVRDILTDQIIVSLVGRIELILHNVFIEQYNLKKTIILSFTISLLKNNKETSLIKGNFYWLQAKFFFKG